MTKTDQAHSWTIYAVLGVFSLTICYTFAFTDKLSVEAFVGLASNVILFFFSRQKPGENGNASPAPAGQTQPQP